jgi:hypothetical protein
MELVMIRKQVKALEHLYNIRQQFAKSNSTKTIGFMAACGPSCHVLSINIARYARELAAKSAPDQPPPSRTLRK